MPKPTKGARLGGGPAHERLLLGNLAAALFTHKSIKTTELRAKRLRPVAERLITFAKRGDLASRRRVMRAIGDKTVVHELFTEIAPLVEERQGGYTRITKLGYRKGDNASMVQIELVLEPVNAKPKAAKTTRSEERAAAAAEAAEVESTETEVAEAEAADVAESVEATEVPVEQTAEPADAAAADAANAKAEEAAAGGAAGSETEGSGNQQK